MNSKNYFKILSILFLAISGTGNVAAGDHAGDHAGDPNEAVPMLGAMGFGGAPRPAAAGPAIVLNEHQGRYQQLKDMNERGVNVAQLKQILTGNFDPEGFNPGNQKLDPIRDVISLAQIILSNHYAKMVFVKLNERDFVETVTGNEAFFRTKYGFSFIYGWMLNKFTGWKYFSWNYKASAAALVKMLEHRAGFSRPALPLIKQIIRDSADVANSNEFLFSVHSIPRHTVDFPAGVGAGGGGADPQPRIDVGARAQEYQQQYVAARAAIRANQLAAFLDR